MLRESTGVALFSGDPRLAWPGDQPAATAQQEWPCWLRWGNDHREEMSGSRRSMRQKISVHCMAVNHRSILAKEEGIMR